MAAFWDLSESGELNEPKARLESLGYDEFGVEFALNPDSYYFPNVRGNRLVKPRGVGEDKIAICALSRYVTYAYEGPSLHHMQHTALGSTKLASQQLNEAQKYFKNMPKLVEPSLSVTDLASVYSPMYQPGDGSDLAVLSKPMIIFNFDPEYPQAALPDPGVVLHEIVHVVQALCRPYRLSGERLKRELEAYSVQSKMIDVYSVQVTEPTRTAYEVEKFRSSYLQSNDFDPDLEFRVLFARQPQFGGIVRGLALKH